MRGDAVEHDAIGGFLELEMPAATGPLHPQAINFQSARAAFLALLIAGRPKRVWLPYYLCFTMLSSLRQAGIDAAFYSIDRKLHIKDDISLADGDWLLFVDYFGLRSDHAAAVAERYGRERVVIDASQALFSGPFNCLATVYSPRKFIGVPDGGVLVTEVPVQRPAVRDEGSFERALPLLKRAAFRPEDAYAEHHRAEKTLFDQQPVAMSQLTTHMLACVDYENVRRSRNDNFSFLHAQLGSRNLLSFQPAQANGPLCYPLLLEHVDGAGLRQHLIGRRIFVPTYWRDVLDLVPEGAEEAILVHQLVPLPCDQRYGKKEMQRIVDACLEYFRCAERRGTVEASA